MKCPCDSGKSYEKCCKKYHDGEAAPTPEALMRSRYAAYALCLPDYILATAKEKSTRADIERFAKNTQFEKLMILKVEPAHVTFHAQLSQNGQDISFTERSLFEQIHERWIYVSGEHFSKNH